MVFSMKYSRGAVRKSGRYRHRKRMKMIKRKEKEGVRNPGTDWDRKTKKMKVEEG